MFSRTGFRRDETWRGDVLPWSLHVFLALSGRLGEHNSCPWILLNGHDFHFAESAQEKDIREVEASPKPSGRDTGRALEEKKVRVTWKQWPFWTWMGGQSWVGGKDRLGVSISLKL